MVHSSPFRFRLWWAGVLAVTVLCGSDRAAAQCTVVSTPRGFDPPAGVTLPRPQQQPGRPVLYSFMDLPPADGRYLYYVVPADLQSGEEGPQSNIVQIVWQAEDDIVTPALNDPNVSAVTGAIGALKGPLHGGAPGPVLDMLQEIKTIDRAEDWVRQAIAHGDRMMGFGHRVYKVRDPRADVLSRAAKELAESGGGGTPRRVAARRPRATDAGARAPAARRKVPPARRPARGPRRRSGSRCAPRGSGSVSASARSWRRWRLRSRARTHARA